MSDLISLELADIRKRLKALESGEAPLPWGDVIGRHQALPVLRGFWPMSSADNTGAIYDLGGQAQQLTWVAPVNIGVHASRVPYAEFNGTSNLFRADNAVLSVTAALTLGGWFWQDALGSSQMLMSKWNGGTSNRSYVLQSLPTNVLRVAISSNGVLSPVFDGSTAIVAGTWNHIVARYTPSTEVAIFLNGVKTSITSSIPAAIFDSTANFRIGAFDDAGAILDGRATLCFLCASALADQLIVELYQRSAPFLQ